MLSNRTPKLRDRFMYILNVKVIH